MPLRCLISTTASHFAAASYLVSIRPSQVVAKQLNLSFYNLLPSYLYHFGRNYMWWNRRESARMNNEFLVFITDDCHIFVNFWITFWQFCYGFLESKLNITNPILWCITRLPLTAVESVFPFSTEAHTEINCSTNRRFRTFLDQQSYKSGCGYLEWTCSKFNNEFINVLINVIYCWQPSDFHKKMQEHTALDDSFHDSRKTF